MHLSRPASLFPLFASVTSLPGIGTRLASIMEKRIGTTVLDLLRHAPVGLIDRTARPAIPDIVAGQLVTIEVLITKHDIAPRHISRPTKITAENETGDVELVFFKADPNYIKRSLPVGERRIISGTAELFQGRVQISHPDYVLSPADKAQLPLLEPVYPLSAGLKGKTIRKAITAALPKVPHLPEWVAASMIAQQKWPDFATAMALLHAPEKLADLSPDAPHRIRLAYDELLANQLALALIRKDTIQAVKGKSVAGDGHLRGALRDALPFSLTAAQDRVLDEIASDQASTSRMLRLVQGDVGSGKTLVALMAMLNAVEAGRQAVMIAPTEILAKQHYKTISDLISRLSDQANISVSLLIGGAKTKAKQAVLDDMADGSANIVIGTHALLTDDVIFADLGLAVVDEQHRFGVKQRMALSAKGDDCDVVVMTATPIPRTLSMTAYGDLQSSIIDEKPAGRKPIDTALVSLERIAEIVEKLRSRLSPDFRAYWICPLVEDSDKSDITAAENRYDILKNLLPDANPTLVHGRMKADEKQAVMEQFQSGASQLLVATTVIEVGVDVPEAGIMIIEHAERFGLAQLHQLRGRVGRGAVQSACLLAYQGPLSETATARLKIMRDSNDGFRLAEEDLRLRGPGEVLGQRQSGMPEFALVDLAYHGDMIGRARDEADRIIAADPDLTSEAGQAYRLLLSLFERDNAIKFLASG